jgi:outer membrane receptor for ferrienterochelin and colicins
MLKKSVLVMLTALLILAVPVSAQEDVMDLDEVVVTASRYEESIMDTPVSIEVIDQEEIEESNAQNVAALLELAGGVYIKDNGSLMAKKDITIRGYTESRIIILLDGQPYSSPNDGEISLEAIPVGLIKRIEVLKSPGSAIYGPNAMGGVINIITKDGQDIEKTNIKVSLGSYDKRNFNISRSFRNDQSSIIFIYDSLNSNGHRPNSEIDRDDLFIKTKLKTGEFSTLNFSLKYNETNLEFPGSDLGDPSGAKIEEELNLNAFLVQNLENKDRTISIFTNDRDTLIPYVGDSNSQIDIKRTGLNIRETKYLNNHIINYGFEIISDESVNIYNDPLFGSTNYDESNLNKAVFIEDKYNINENNIINIGIRYDDHEEYGSELSPRLGYLYKINKNLNFNLLYGESYKAPTYLQLYFPAWGGGNPDLIPETTKSYEVGFKYNKNNCSREISIFKRDGKDFIAVKDGFYTNFNSVTIEGLDFSSNRTINKNWKIGFNYTYLDAINDENGERLGDIPYNQFDIIINYRLNDIKVNLNNRFLGSRIDGASGNELSSNFISDLKISNNLTEKTKIAFEINNLFDKDYEVVDGYPMPGRNFMVNLSTKF